MKKVPGINYASHIKLLAINSHKILKESSSDMYSNTDVWKVKQIYSRSPSGFYC